METLLFTYGSWSAVVIIAVVTVGAIVKVHWQHGFFLNWSLTPGKGHGFEAHLALLRGVFLDPLEI